MLLRGVRKVQRRTRGYLVTLMLRAGGAKVGNNLEVEPGTTFRWGGHKGISVGANVRFGRGVVVDVPHGAVLTIGDSVKVMHYSVIAAAKHIEIGRDSQIAEHCSIRDSDHGLSLSVPIADQIVATTTRIGDGVWLGRGVAVLRGSDVGRDAVIGANSLVKGKVDPRTVAIGTPAVAVRVRGSD